MSNTVHQQPGFEHTPGPWTVGHPDWTGPHYVMVGGHTEIACVHAHGEGSAYTIPDVYERAANARLIAAAPDLLKALEALFEHCAMVHNRWGDGSNQKQADAAIAAGRAALAKARGTADASHAPGCAQRAHGANECNCGVADREAQS